MVRAPYTPQIEPRQTKDAPVHADPYRRKLHFRAHHRGTREADALVGGFYDRYSAEWDEAGFAWFERLLEEQDVDILAWAMGTADADPAFAGPMMDDLKRLDFISLPPGTRG